ncbi:NSFL1 cofactor p47 [Frankliniella occidentalis]|uniref:NSFL1 cofactor p47 n=1 Tax=Frankliniella occidentalis TaxID=133901 RepID=A0A6J1RZB3_FRAOC|nr:NSFL1 cofactor p47 [Frankliniella occidentalis]
MSNQADQLATFIDLTKAPEDRARFFLESSGWQLEVALASFFEADNDTEMDRDSPEVVPVAMPSEPQLAPEPPSRPSGSKKGKSKSKSSSSNRVRTLASLRQDSDDSDSGNEEGQAFYAGGSDSSGQQILGPSKNKNKMNKEEFVAQMFKSVKEHGAEEVDPIRLPGSGGPSTSSFGGRGYRLGQTPDDIEEVTAGGSSRQPPQVNVTLKMWRDGFTVNDGPMRGYADPENKEFLECIRKGEIPRELIREARGSEVHVNIEAHSHEEPPAYKAKVKAFTGKGNVLGSPVPSANPPSGIPSGIPDGRTKEELEAAAKQEVTVDASQPSTTIQVRLTDGSTLVARLNHSHTVGDLRRYINLARPQYSSASFSLHTTFPRKELSDNSQSVQDAGLLNAAVLQRLG